MTLQAGHLSLVGVTQGRELFLVMLWLYMTSGESVYLTESHFSQLYKGAFWATWGF